MRGGRRGAVALAVAAMFGITAPAAASSGRVALARPAAADPTIVEALNRIRGELVAEGFDVVVVDLPASQNPAEPPPTPPTDPTALATIGLTVDEGTRVAELRVVDRLTNKVVIRRSPVDDSPSVRPAEVLAVRAVELLRASLLELLVAAPKAPQAPLAEVRQARMFAARALPPEREPAWGVEVGAAVLGDTGGVPPAFIGVVRARWKVASPLDLRATIAGFGTTPRVEQAGVGNANVTQAFALVEAVGVLWRATIVHPKVSLGAGALYVSVDGHAEGDAYHGRGDTLFAFVADAGIGAEVRLDPHFELSLEGHAMLATPQPVVSFATTDVARTGLPFLVGSLSVVGWL